MWKDEAKDGFAASKSALHSARRALRQEGVRQEALTGGQKRKSAVSHVRQRDQDMERTFLGHVNHVERAFLDQVNLEMHMETLNENSTAKSGASDDVLKSREDMGNGVDPAVPAAAAKGLALSRVAAWDSAHATTNLATHGTINKRDKDNGVNKTVMEEAATKLANTLVHQAHESAAAIPPTYRLLRPLMGAAAMHMPHTELMRKKKPHLSLPQTLPEAHLHLLQHLEHSGTHVQHGPSSLLTLSLSPHPVSAVSASPLTVPVLQHSDEGANLAHDADRSLGRNSEKSHFQ
jgi:hypothetical protein